MNAERALYELLHHRCARAAWRAGTLDLPDDVARTLASLDPDEVDRAALLVVRAIRTRRARGTGGGLPLSGHHR